MKILLAEDDRLLNHHLKSILQEEDHQVYAAHQAEEALHFAEDYPIDVAIIDLGLPDMDGLTLIRQLRDKQIPFPILILTARGNWQDKVAGLEAGADDYMVKPCDLGELAARLRALIRRAAGAAAPIMQIGALSLDPASREVRYENNVVELSPREFDLLHELMLNAGKVLTRAQLESKIYPWGEEVESNALEVHVHHLRRKTATEVIKTVRGVGYLMPK